MSTTIAIYKEVCAITHQMLAAARQADWDMLADLERQCSGRIDILRAGNDTSPLSEAERQQKIGIIQQILDDDRKIRELIAPWMTQLSGLINRAGTERRVNRAYGINQSG